MMSAYSKAIPCIPKETVRAANAIFGRGNFYMLVGEQLQAILQDIPLRDFEEMEAFSKDGEATFALITFFQFVEGLTDVQAIDAVRTRTDWKFALHLSLSPGMLHESDLCQFRYRLLRSPVGQQEFQRLIDRLGAFAPMLRDNSQDLKWLEVVALVCVLNRLNRAQQAMIQVLEELSARFPQWLRKNALPHWYGRYNPAMPRLDAAILPRQQRFLMEEIRSDIHSLLEKVHQSSSPEISELHGVRVLEQIWSQQFRGLDQAQNDRPESLKLEVCEICSQTGVGRRYQS